MKKVRNPDGGWLPPNEKELEKFWAECQQEAIRRFGVDEDNNACVIIDGVDRSRYEMFRTLPIPRDIEESPYHPYGKRKWTEGVRDPNTQRLVYPKHKPEEEEARRISLLQNKRERIRMISGNLEMAQDRMKRLTWELDQELGKQIEAPERARLSRITSLENKKSYWADPIKHLEGMGYTVDVEKGVYWNPSRKPEDIRPLPTRPDDFEADMKELAQLKKYKPLKPLEL